MIVDANVFKGYYQAELGNAHSLCGCPLALFSRATSKNQIYHDIGGIIEKEWEAVVDHEWFEQWLASQLTADIIAYVEQKKDIGLEKRLMSLGFPGGRDFVYIRTGLSASNIQNSRCELFTEDLDFYAPKKKGCAAKARVTLLTSSTGPVAKELKKARIDVACVP